jgi:diguanylate cyclase (GGDEF)-like protein
MRVAVDGEDRPGSPRSGVSGAVVHALISFIRAEAGEAGVAQALALAAEERSFPKLGDDDSWTSLDDAAALFGAGALVTGDSSIALHVGEDLLWAGNRGELATRLAALGSPEVAVRHIGALIEQFEGATEAVTLEVEEGHALVQVWPVDSPRHAHLCELTRGLLSELPAVFDRDRAQITEHECAARGGRFCRYAVTWEPGPSVGSAPAPFDPEAHAGDDDADRHDDRRLAPVEVHPSTNGRTPAAQPEVDRIDPGVSRIDPDDVDVSGGTDELRLVADIAAPFAAGTPAEHFAHEAEIESLTTQLRAALAALVEASANATRWELAATTGAAVEDERLRREAEEEAARTRIEIGRLEHLLEGASSPTIGLLERDSDTVVAELGDRAERVLDAGRFLLMIRVGSGMPLQLHHRGLGPDEASDMAAELWSASPEGVAATIQVVDIASSLRRYGRLAILAEVDGAEPEADDRVLRMFAQYAANVLDVLTVVNDVRRSDSTARTLLSFGEQLSGLTNLAQALQILADTVPGVTGCDQSTVYLWDRDRSRLVLGAYTTGMTPPDADLGPFSLGWAGASSTTEIRVAPSGEGSDAGDGTLSVGVDNPLIEQMITSHRVMVLDASAVEDPELRALMEASDIPASVVAPLFAAGEFLGVIAANFATDAAQGAIHDPDLHERLSGLADQAATAIQNLELLEKVSHMAWHDALTGLPNRRLFEDRVEQELVRSRRVGEPVSMFFVDLDNFKTVNDTYGHATGDALIQQVGQRLVETVRSQDTVARLGGDEFAILLPGLVDQLAINQLAERTLDAMHTPFDIFGEQVSTSASVGIAIAPEHGDSYDDLLNRADEAMFRAKDHGRNAFEMFHHSPDPAHPGRRAVDDRQLYNDLISALDGNEFFLVYQPYIDLRTAQIVGVEALIRWDHPTLGILEPSQFIPMAEKSDLIISLDNWVLWQACRQLRAWQDHDISQLRLSVNLASRDLASPTFYDSVERTLRDTDIDPSLLELDITDRVVLDASGPAKDNINRLRRLGVRFTIDDFGQGNSSLDRIGSFPVSTLKIDQSFVQVLGAGEEEDSLVSAIIAMASRLGLSCVAEGVETLLQSRVLLQRGCTTAQGYYFSRPLPPDGIEEMLANLSPAEVPESFGNPSNGSQPPEKPTD